MLVVVVYVVGELSASACPAGSPPTDKPVDREAVSHLAAGNRAYKAAIDKKHPLSDDARQRQLETAIAEYLAGQRCDDAFVFDFNLGQALAALGKRREALEHLLRFLARADLDDADRANVEKRIAAVDPSGSLRAERQAAASRPSAPPSPPTEIPRAVAAAQPTQAPSMSPVDRPTEHPPLSPSALSPTRDSGTTSSVRWGRIAGWTLTAAGVVGAGVTTYFVLDAQNLDHQATDAEANREASVRNELSARAADRRRSAVIVGIGSGVVLATGLAIALWPSGDRSSTQASWNLGITGNGIAVAGRF